MKKNDQRKARCIQPADYQAAYAHFEYDPMNEAAIFNESARSSSLNLIGGHPYANHEDCCKRILGWFLETSPFLCDEQAVRDLKIPNFRARIADLRRRGFVIHGEPLVMHVSATRLHTSMVYALHRDVPEYVLPQHRLMAPPLPGLPSTLRYPDSMCNWPTAITT